MKVFNLTDIPTKSLEQYGLVNQHIVVGRALLSPGESVAVADNAITRNGLQHYVSVGAVAVDSLPPSYVIQKDKASSAKKVEEVKSEPFGRRK